MSAERRAMTACYSKLAPSCCEKMIRQVLLAGSLIALAYVYCKPTVLHRAKRWEDFPNLTFTFDCSDRAVGFYADTEHHCQIFHMCDEDGRRIPYICANDTSFNQEFRVCDWEYNFDCSQAPQWYYLNELTYVTDPPKPRVPNPDSRSAATAAFQ